MKILRLSIVAPITLLASALSAGHDAYIAHGDMFWNPSAPSSFATFGTGTEWKASADVTHKNDTGTDERYTITVVLLIDNTPRDTALNIFLAEYTGSNYTVCPIETSAHYWNPGPPTAWIGTTKSAKVNGVMKYQGTNSGNAQNSVAENVGFH